VTPPVSLKETLRTYSISVSAFCANPLSIMTTDSDGQSVNVFYAMGDNGNDDSSSLNVFDSVEHAPKTKMQY
jgi:hypothetical protein